MEQGYYETGKTHGTNEGFQKGKEEGREEGILTKEQIGQSMEVSLEQVEALEKGKLKKKKVPCIRAPCTRNPI